MDSYILPSAAIKALELAKKKNITVYVRARSYFGKTTLIKEHLKEKEYTYISCEDGFPKIPDYSATENIVVIDDLQFAKSIQIFELLQRLINDNKKSLYIISRAPLPEEIMCEFISNEICRLDEENISVTLADVLEFCGHESIDIDDEILEDLLSHAQGSAPVMCYFIRSYIGGKTDLEDLYENANNMLISLMISRIITQWDSELSDTMTKLSIVDSFSLEFAELITGNYNVKQILTKAQNTGNFLFFKNGVYTLDSFSRAILYKRLEDTISPEGIKQLKNNAGLYYEMHDDLMNALAMYKECDNSEKIKELLIRNGKKAVANAHFFELRHFYLSIPEEEVCKSSVLMSSLSELHSILLQTDKSEYWYKKLEEFEASATGREKREAKECLLYLDLCLPHRTSTDYVKIIKKLPTAVFDKDMRMPAFNPTSNLPGIMNGGLDFSDWSKNDKTLATTIGWILEKAFKNGTVNIALGESQYEKGEDIYNVISLLSKGQIEANNCGSDPMLFAATGILARANCSQGEIDNAFNLMNSFRKKIHNNESVDLYGNVDALICRLNLIQGNLGAVKKWLSDTPDENDDFNAVERYIYMTKIRSYIAIGEYTSAYTLLEKMLFYTENFRRICMNIEANILMAILNDKIHRDFKENLISALKTASEYRFVRIISEEGNAVLHLLKQIDTEVRDNPEIDNRWFDKVLHETALMAIHYPAYLASAKINTADFCENALRILGMQANGYSNAEIAKALGISVDNVKYHTKQNYKKLGVNNKADAIISARELKLI